MTRPYKLSIRIGASSFDGEGDEESVRADYQKFLDKLSGHQRGTFFDGMTAWLENEERKPKTSSESDMLASLYASEKALTVLEAKMLFEVGTMDQSVSLKNYHAIIKLPAPDAILLLLLGHKIMLSDDEISASELTNAAHASGYAFERLDRVLAPYKDKYVGVLGETRGTKYALNIRGQARATWLARRVLDALKKERPGR